jgi:hypothetical protein
MLLHGSAAVMVSNSIGGFKGPRGTEPGIRILVRTAAFFGRIWKCVAIFFSLALVILVFISFHPYGGFGGPLVDGLRRDACATGNFFMHTNYTDDGAFDVFFFTCLYWLVQLIRTESTWWKVRSLAVGQNS